MLKRSEKNLTWYRMQSEEIADFDILRQEFGFDEEKLTYIVDINELAHLEYDKEKGDLFLIYNALDLTREEGYYQTVPLTFYVKGGELISIASRKSDYIQAEMDKSLSQSAGMSVYEFLFRALVVVSKNYFATIESLNRERNRLNQLLRQKTSKDELLALSDLETGLVYLVAASKQNALLLDQLKTQTFVKNLTETEREELDDAIVEAKQVMEMTQLSAQILDQLEGTYNNILNNELNDTMSALTMFSIMLTIPSIITAFFGMNVILPDTFATSPVGWLLVLALTAFIMFILECLLTFYMDKRGIETRVFKRKGKK